MTESLADAIAKGLVSGLTHPGNPEDGSQPHAIVLPVFNTVGQPPEIVEQVAEMAKSLAEAIVFLIQDKGLSVVETAELDGLRATYDPQKGQRTVSVNCRCGTTLMMMNVNDSPDVTIDGGSLLSGFRTKSTECPHREDS